MKVLLLYIIGFLLFTTVVSVEEEKCCSKCTNEGEVKYYSIDKKYDMCGECCLNPKKFYLFKIFESGLTLAENENPCETLGYSSYEETETHGFLFLKVSLDKYKKPE